MKKFLLSTAIVLAFANQVNAQIINPLTGAPDCCPHCVRSAADCARSQRGIDLANAEVERRKAAMAAAKQEYQAREAAAEKVRIEEEQRQAELHAERLKAEAAQRERDQILHNQRLAEEAAARAEQNKRDAEAHAIQLDRERVLAAERQKKFEAEQAERKRLADAKAAEEAKPANVLFRAYTRYAYVKFCNQVREGYALQYVNDFEMQRATNVIKAIKDKAVKDELNLDTDYAWTQGLQEAQRLLSANAMGPDQCHWAYSDLLGMSPTTPYVVTKPN